MISVTSLHSIVAIDGENLHDHNAHVWAWLCAGWSRVWVDDRAAFRAEGIDPYASSSEGE